MMLPFLVFFFVTGGIVAIYLASRSLGNWLSSRQVEQRLREVSGPVVDDDTTTVVMQSSDGPLPGVDRLVAKTEAGASLAKLIEQAGVVTTPGAVVAKGIGLALVGGVVGFLFGSALVGLGVGVVGLALPFLWLVRKRSTRLKKFEEQFPEALELLSRAIRAGHAFQTAMGMAADELPAPVGVEFKKAFEQQNFGLPLKEALTEMAERVPSLDVKFFITSVAIQRETGGNLAEILDNLARVVRERFKIRRQVRVHTAHGRFTGYVLLALPATLALALTWLSPEHMKLLFEERMGQMMLVGAMVMQAIGFAWIRQVIKIEV
jgi:tight adherence protein B